MTAAAFDTAAFGRYDFVIFIDCWNPYLRKDVSKPEIEQGDVSAPAPRDRSARRRASSFFVIVLLCLACAFAVGMQIANLPSVLRSRAESALASGDYSEAMKFFIRIRRIERNSKPSEPKMREIALSGISKHYESGKTYFAQGRLREALNEYAAGKALAEDYFFVFPTQQFLAPKDDDLLALLDTIKDDSCFMGRVHTLRSEWVRARVRLQECEKQDGSRSSSLFWQTYVSSVTWDWNRAIRVLQKLLKVSAMDSRLEDFEKRSRGKKIAKAPIKSLIPDELHPTWALVELMNWHDLAHNTYSPVKHLCSLG